MSGAEKMEKAPARAERAADLSEAALAKLPPDRVAKLRAFRALGESFAARGVDFEEWKRVAYESRR